MNEHGAAALVWWPTELPISFSKIENPEEYFAALGEKAEAEIEDRFRQHAGEDRPEESAKDKAARLEQARARAVEEIYAELVRPDPVSHGEPYADLDQALAALAG